jgi:Putative restriction endonuclease
VYQEAPLVVAGIDSEPEPDVMVCSSPDRSANGTSRTRPLLVIEVADSSLEYDMQDKAALHADAGVPEYWVVQFGGGLLEVFRDARKSSYHERFALEPALGSRRRHGPISSSTSRLCFPKRNPTGPGVGLERPELGVSHPVGVPCICTYRISLPSKLRALSPVDGS